MGGNILVVQGRDLGEKNGKVEQSVEPKKILRGFRDGGKFLRTL